MDIGFIFLCIFAYVIIGGIISTGEKEDRFFAYVLFWPIIIVFLGFKQLIEIISE